MSYTKKLKNIHDKQGIRGRFRLNIIEVKNGKKVVVGDSGWNENTLTNLGVQAFVVQAMLSTAGSSQVAYAAFGSSASVSAAATTIPNEVVGTGAASTAGRFAVAGVVTGSRTVQYTGSLQSNVVNAATTIGAVGLFANSTASSGQIFCGQTFASSPLATNQAVNLTYQVQFP